MQKRRSKFLLLFLFSVIIFSSCNNPLHRIYRAATYEDDMEAIRKSNKVSDEDLEILNKYIMLVKLSGKDISGKSYDEILDRIKTFQQKNNELSSSDALVKDAKRQRLSPFLEVKLQNKTFTKLDNKNVLAYKVSFKNTGTLKIKTITGSLVFNDVLGKPIKNLNIFLDEDIAPKETISKTYNTDYNDADENDKSIRSKDVLDVRVVWNSDKIIFENGRIAE
jgi:hypothetical protein